MFCVQSHNSQRDFLGWGLAEAMFSITADGEGTQLGRLERVRTGTDANVVLIVSKVKVQ